MIKKEEGFPGQISFVLPARIQAMIVTNPLLADLYITDIGFYPRAMFHERERPEGCSQFILIYCVDGQGEINLSGNIYQLPTDHYFILPSGVPHAYKSDKADPWSIYWIHFSGKKSWHFKRYALQVMPVERSAGSRINDRIDLFSEIFRNLERGFGVETLEYVNQCLPYLLASFTHLNQFRLIRERGNQDPVTHGINFMLDHLTEKLKLEDIAGSASLSASHFARLFTSQTGHSPIDYFIQLKIQRACRLLDMPGRKLTDVALEMGFEDKFYFSRIFSKVMGMPPAKYQRRGG